MPYYYNSKEEFGEPGPFEAESKESFADEMENNFRQWAYEAWYRLEDWERADYNGTYNDFIRNASEKMRKNFINGLECVLLYHRITPTKEAKPCNR